MVAFNFQPQFVDDIRSGKKTQTIRRRARAKEGDRLQLYTGMRTSHCRKIIEADPICILTNYIHLQPDGITFGNASLSPSADEFARMDGFRDYADMHAWFAERYGSPYFVGALVRWRLDDAQA